MYQRLQGISDNALKLNGCFLLFAVGILFGLSVPLSKLATELEAQPIGLALWVNVIAGVLCLTITAFRRRLPVIDRRLCRFVFLWGLLGTVGGDVLLFWVVQHLPASTVSIILVCEGFMVYGCVAARGKVPSNRKNLTGLAVGMLGIMVLIGNGASLSTAGQPVWILLALAVPAVFAAEDLLICGSMPESDLLASTGLAAIAGSVMLLPVAWYLNDFITLSWIPSRLEIAILSIAVSSALGTLLMVRLMTGMGAVYGSQTGYTITFAGIAWSIVLLNERLNEGTFIALLLMLIGLMVVEPGNPERSGSNGIV